MGKKKKKKLGKIIGVIVLCIIAVVGIVGVKMKKAQSAAGAIVKTTTIVESTIESNIEGRGQIVSKDKEEIITVIDQKINKVVAKVGDKVKPGDILAELDTKELEYQLKKDELNLDVAKLKLEQLKKNSKAEITNKYFAAELTFNDAQKTYEDKKKLAENGAISENDLTQAKSLYEKSKSDFLLVKDKYERSDSSADIRILASEVKGYELSVKKLKERITQTSITSPIEGIVTFSKAKKGMIASGANPLFIIEDLNALEVTVNISEYDISKIELGQDVEIKCDGAENMVYKGQVSHISPSAIVNQNGQGQETVVPIRARIDNLDDRLKPNFSASVTIMVDKKDGVLTIPYEAIYNTKEGGKIIFVIEKDKAVAKDITTGIEGDTILEIKGEGLSADDIVILYPNEDIVDGLNVTYEKPKEEEKKND